MLTAVPLFYTGLIISLNVIARGGGSNLFPPEQFWSFTQGEIDERIRGSKVVLISEQVSWDLLKQVFYPTDILSVYAERHLGIQGLYVVHVRPYDIGNDTHQTDQIRCYIRSCWLGRCTDRVFHCLSTIPRLLGHAATKPSMHHT